MGFPVLDFFGFVGGFLGGSLDFGDFPPGFLVFWLVCGLFEYVLVFFFEWCLLGSLGFFLSSAYLSVFFD